jgi:hypothetical protein
MQGNQLGVNTEETLTLSRQQTETAVAPDLMQRRLRVVNILWSFTDQVRVSWLRTKRVGAHNRNAQRLRSEQPSR